MLLHPQIFFSTSSSHSTTNIVQRLNLGLKYDVYIRDLCAQNSCILPRKPEYRWGSGLTLQAKLMFFFLLVLKCHNFT